MKVVDFSDGKTWFGLRHENRLAGWLVLGPGTLMSALALFVMLTQPGIGLPEFIASLGFLVSISIAFLRCVLNVEEIAVSPIAIARRRRFSLKRTDVVLLDEISTVVVSGTGTNTHLYLQRGRVTLGLAQRRRPFTELELRWLAKRYAPRLTVRARLGRGSSP